jgi:hypothetical protein
MLVDRRDPFGAAGMTDEELAVVEQRIVNLKTDSPCGASCLCVDPTTVGAEFAAPTDWRDIAVRMGGGGWAALTTRQADALRSELDGQDERTWGVRHERTNDAKGGSES